MMKEKAHKSVPIGGRVAVTGMAQEFPSRATHIATLNGAGDLHF
jgi:hypothetical protein